jgi:hypothetical protein
MAVLIILSFGFIASLFSISAQAQGLASGNQFEIVPIYGSLNVSCPGVNNTPRSVQWLCQDERLSPEEYDYFVGPDVDSDTVELNAVSAKTHALTQKLAGYMNGQSRVRFNLWIRSLLQTPLLNEGANTVTYILKKAGQVVQTGQFTVQVGRGKTLQCPSAAINSGTPEDCNNPMTLCDQYFQNSNYCQ